MQTVLARVVWYALGGTIASRSSAGGGAHPALAPEELLAATPGVHELAELVAIPHRQVISTALTLVDLIEVAQSAQRAIAHGADGVVITTGTDTMEETAFALDLLWTGSAPLVITGAMRPADQPGTDAPANLLSAVRVAASPTARGLGCVVVINDEIHAARHVQKTHTTNPAAFRSTASGPLGHQHEGKVNLLTRPIGRPHLPPVDAGQIKPVALVRCALGDDGRLLSAIPTLDYEGLIVDAAGGGTVPPDWAEPLGQLAAIMPVVYASRVGAGRVLEATYGAPGCEQDLIARGLIPAGMLDGLKARILLTMLLTSDASSSEIRDAFRNPYTP
jgi:L-asparaginase